MSDRCPIGFNARDDFDHALMYERAARMGGLRGFLAQLGPDKLNKLKALLPLIDYPIWRTHHDDKLFDTHKNAEAWVDERLAELAAAGMAPGDVFIHLHNEAGLSPQVVAWEERAVRHGLTKGAKFVCLNVSVGTPEPGQIGLAAPLLLLSHQHPQRVLIGLHEYFYVLHDAYNSEFVWHVGRVKNWIAYSEQQKITPSFVITEYGADILGDVKDREPGRWPFTMAPDGAMFTELRGYKTLDAAYKQDFGSEYTLLGLGGLYARECVRGWTKALLGRVKFALVFSVGQAYSSGWRGETPWPQFNVELDEQAWAFWRTWWLTHPVPHPQPEPEPEPPAPDPAPEPEPEPDPEPPPPPPEPMPDVPDDIDRLRLIGALLRQQAATLRHMSLALEQMALLVEA